MAAITSLLAVGLFVSAGLLMHGLRISCAQLTGGHSAVETMMCTNLSEICPCNANRLHVIASKALECGTSQELATVATLPIIKPPIGVTLEQDSLYTVMILDRDAPSRQLPLSRYWVHGLFADITSADMASGDITKGSVLKAYNRPSPPRNSGPHSYQILQLRQDPTVGADNMEGLAHLSLTNGGFKAQNFLTTNKMCGEGQLIGAFEFHCSNPDGEDPKNPDRQCPYPPAVAPPATGSVTSQPPQNVNGDGHVQSDTDMTTVISATTGGGIIDSDNTTSGSFTATTGGGIIESDNTTSGSFTATTGGGIIESDNTTSGSFTATIEAVTATTGSGSETTNAISCSAWHRNISLTLVTIFACLAAV